MIGGAEDDEVQEDDVEDDEVEDSRMMMLTRRADPKTGAHTFCDPCAIDMHLDKSQEPFCARIDR